MALAYNIVRRMPDVSKAIVDITLDGSYAAGGYALAAAGLGMEAAPDMVDPQVVTTVGAGFIPSWNQQTGKLQMFKTGAALSGVLAECVAGDLSASVKVRCEVTGIPLI